METIVDIRKNATGCIPKILSTIFDNTNFDFEAKLNFVKFRIKSEKSILQKCKYKNIGYKECYDLIGIRFVVKTQSDCYKFLNSLKLNSYIQIKEVRDYIKTPQLPNGYRAIHILINYQGVPCEIQILSYLMYNQCKGLHSKYKNKTN